MNPKTLKKCELCIKDKVLQRSHILPEFVYKPLYDEKGRTNSIELNSGRKKYIQNGAKEYLLCSECEHHLNKYEKYVYSLFMGKIKSLNSRKVDSVYIVEGLNYRKFKIFTLSLLWRASLSKHQLFKYIDLKNDNEILRNSILKSDPLKVDQYPFILRPILTQNYDPLGIVTQVISFTINQHHCYRFVFLGIQWFLFTSDCFGFKPKKFFLNEKGVIHVQPFIYSKDEY